MPIFLLELDAQTDNIYVNPIFAEPVLEGLLLDREVNLKAADDLLDGQIIDPLPELVFAERVIDGQLLNIFGIGSPDGNGNTMYYQNAISYDPSLGQNILTSIKIVPMMVGEYVKLSFPVDEDPWVDEFGWLLFKPSGRTIGSANSGADYARDDLELLFNRLHRNPHLKLFNSTGVEVSKGLAESDWLANRRLKLPLHPGASFVSPGRNSSSDTNWEVGEVKGTNSYVPPLPLHDHDIFIPDHGHNIAIADHGHNLIQTPHSHQISQTPHSHPMPIHQEGSTNEFGGRDFDNSDSLTFSTNPALVDLSIGEETINLSIEPEPVFALIEPAQVTATSSSEGNLGEMNITPPATCVEIFIFSGVRAIPE